MRIRDKDAKEIAIVEVSRSVTTINAKVVGTATNKVKTIANNGNIQTLQLLLDKNMVSQGRSSTNVDQATKAVERILLISHTLNPRWTWLWIWSGIMTRSWIWSLMEARCPCSRSRDQMQVTKINHRISLKNMRQRRSTRQRSSLSKSRVVLITRLRRRATPLNKSKKILRALYLATSRRLWIWVLASHGRQQAYAHHGKLTCVEMLTWHKVRMVGISGKYHTSMYFCSPTNFTFSLHLLLFRQTPSPFRHKRKYWTVKPGPNKSFTLFSDPEPQTLNPKLYTLHIPKLLRSITGNNEPIITYYWPSNNSNNESILTVIISIIGTVIIRNNDVITDVIMRNNESNNR